MNNYNPNFHHRKSIRLKGYDYSQAGLYFITICCQRRGNPLWLPFGHIENNEMQLNDSGKMIETEWLVLSERFTNSATHEFVVMPNHFHGILQIVGASDIDEQNLDDKNLDEQNLDEQNLDDRNLGDKNLGDRNLDDKNLGDRNLDEQNLDEQNLDYKNLGDKNINNLIGQPQGIAPTKKIGDMMDAFKSITTVKYINGVKTLGWQKFDGKLWQRNYYEHIIRNEQAYQNISNYIINNPAKWQEDKFYAL